MAKLKVKRREFLKYTSLSTLAFMPGIRGLATLFGNADPQGFITHRFRLINYRNLLNVEFYFINTIDSTKGSRKTLDRDNTRLNAYMIVRLPQQHVAEEYIYKNSEVDDWNLGSDKVGDKLYVQTRIAGYSYLVFKIEFDRNPGEDLPLRSRDLMNWNSDWFTLIVRSDLENPIFELKDKWDDPEAGPSQNEYPLGYRSNPDDPSSFSFSEENFPRAYAHTFKESLPGSKHFHYDPSPFTAIEVPYRLILSPQLPDPYHYDFIWSFSSRVRRDRAELWMAILTVAKKAGAPKVVTGNDHANQNRVSGTDMLQLMILGSPDFRPGDKGNSNSCDTNIKGFKQDFLRNYLPRKADRQDLVTLYFTYNLMDKLSQRLTASAPQLGFSPLGLSSEIEFKNKDYQRNNISLYEWKQSLSFGRDQEVKVSRVVVEACFGMKMLHVETTKRRTVQGVSALVYEEFLMPLEAEKDYTLYDNDQNITTYQNTNYKCGTPFKKVRFADLKPKQIRPIEHYASTDNDKYIIRSTGADCESIYAYWPLAYEASEDANIQPTSPQNIYLEWNFIGTDWHGVDTHFKKKIFVLTSMLSFQPNAKGEENLFTDTPVSITDKGQLKTYDQLNTELANTYDAPTGKDTWFRILNASDDFLLRQLNTYRDFLDPVLTDLESKIMAQAGQIEDVVSEKFNAYKTEVLQFGLNIFQSANNALSELTHTIETNLASLSAAAKGDYANIIQPLIYTYSNRWTEITTGANTWWLDLCTKIETNLTTNLPALKDLVTRMRGIDFSTNSTAEFDRFLAAVPPKYKQLLTDTYKDIRTRAADVKKVGYRIEELEHSFRSKISIYRNTVGYAVYQMEDQLQKFKTTMEQKINSRLQNAKDIAQKVIDQVTTTATEEYNSQVARLSKFKTDYLILQNNVRSMAGTTSAGTTTKKIFNFFDDYSCFPQLHTARVYMDHVNDMVQKEIPLKIAYAQDYVKNQLDDKLFNYQDNASRVFAQLHAEGKEYLKGAMRQVGSEIGGMVNPELPADFVTYLKKGSDAVKDTQALLQNMGNDAQQLVNAVNDQYKTAADSLKQTATNIVGSVDALGAQVTSQIAAVRDQINQDIQDEVHNAGEVFQSQKNQLVLIGQQAKDKFEQAKGYVQMQASEFFGALQSRILGSLRLQDILGVNMKMPELNKANNSVYYNFVTDGLVTKELGPFKFTPGDKTKLVCFLQKSLVKAGEYTSWTRLENFEIDIFDGRLAITFGKLQISSSNQEKNKVSVEIADVQFKKELAFLQALSRSIKIPGTGISIDINPTNITVGFSYAIPGISGGAFSFNNLKFNIGVIIPFPIGSGGMSPLVARFGINAPDDKFVIAAGIFGGRGHFIIGATPKYIKTIDFGFEFGGYLGLDLVIAKGEAFVMAGVRYVYDRDELGEATIDFYSIFTCGGSVTVFGFITISVYFILCLRYEQSSAGNSLYGTATLTYSVKIGFFEKSFSLTYTKRLSGSDNGSGSQGTFSPLRQGPDGVYYVSEHEQQKSEPDPNQLGFTDASWVQFCNSFDLK